jgi:acetyl-CoA carboxylase carboxyltransferase component
LSVVFSCVFRPSIDNETLGGATTYCEISGVTDYKAKDDKDALDRIKNIVDKIGDFDKAGYSRIKAMQPALDEKEIYGVLPKLVMNNMI